MTRTDNGIFLPNPEEIKTIDDVRNWATRVASILGSNQGDIYDDLTKRIDTTSTQSVHGTKSFSALKLTGSMDCNQKQMVSMVVENRITDPSNPVTGQIWFRTDLV